MNDELPKDHGGHEPAADASSALVAWAMTAARHWKGSLVVALAAGAATAAADNPLKPVSQVSFLVAQANGAEGVTGGTGDLVKLLTAASVPDGGRNATVTAKADRDSGIVSVVFTLHRQIDADGARSMAEALLARAQQALGPQFDAAREALSRELAATAESLAMATRSLEGAPPAAQQTEGFALLLAQQVALRQAVSAVEGKLAAMRAPTIVGDTRMASGRSAFRAWAAPGAAFAVTMLAMPIALRSLSELRGARNAARRN
jgi:hypothetical protein